MGNDGTPLRKSDGTPVMAPDGTPRMGAAGDPCCCTPGTPSCDPFCYFPGGTRISGTYTTDTGQSGSFEVAKTTSGVPTWRIDYAAGKYIEITHWISGESPTALDVWSVKYNDSAVLDKKLNLGCNPGEITLSATSPRAISVTFSITAGAPVTLPATSCTCFSRYLWIRRFAPWHCADTAISGKVCGSVLHNVCRVTGSLVIGSETFTEWWELTVEPARYVGAFSTGAAFHFALGGGRVFATQNVLESSLNTNAPGSVWDDAGGIWKDGVLQLCGHFRRTLTYRVGGGTVGYSRNGNSYANVYIWEAGAGEYVVYHYDTGPGDIFGPYTTFYIIGDPSLANLATNAVDCSAPDSHPPGSYWKQVAVWNCETQTWVRGSESRVMPEEALAAGLGVWIPAAQPVGSTPKGCIWYAYTEGTGAIDNPPNTAPEKCCDCYCPPGGAPESLTAHIQGFNTARDTSLGIYWDSQGVEIWSWDPAQCGQYQGEFTMYYWSEDPEYGSGWFAFMGTVNLWLDSVACKWKCSVYSTIGEHDADEGIEGEYTDGTVIEGGI